MERHGHAGNGKRSREYQIWVGMIARCYNDRHKSYPSYGGRGIRVCSRWLDSFTLFLADMGSCPYPEATLDRKDNDGDYSKKNCHWASPKEQGRNRRDNAQITARGKTQCQAAWAEELGVADHVIHNRRRLGWSDEDIIGTPVKERMPASQARRIYNEYAKGGCTLEELAAKYNSTVSAVQAITCGRNHADATGATYAPVQGRKKYTRLEKTPAVRRRVLLLLKTKSIREVAKELGVSRTVISGML